MPQRVGFASEVSVSTDGKFLIPDEVEEWVGQKKSEYLSVLIEKLEQDDFGFEDFHLFDHLVQKTIESPDSLFEKIDGRQKLLTYIRTYSDTQMFSQIVVGTSCLVEEEIVFIPILSFVTRSRALVKEFSVGQPKIVPTLS